MSGRSGSVGGGSGCGVGMPVCWVGRPGRGWCRGERKRHGVQMYGWGAAYWGIEEIVMGSRDQLLHSN
jgi:hypothetical protein